MKASEFGQSLLSDIREKNKEEQRRAEKRAKRDKWKNLGLSIAMNVAEDVLQTRHQKLLNNEAKMADKITVDTVFQEANSFSANVKKAEEYEGGKDAYYMEELNKLVDAQMKLQYDSDSYSKSQFNSLKNSIVKNYFPKYKEAVDKRTIANKQFLVSGDKERYYSNIKQLVGDGSIGAGLTELVKKIPGVSKLTGNMDEDLRQANQEIVSSLKGKEGLKTYQEVYRSTKDSQLAAYVAQNLKDVDLGAPSPEFSKRFEQEIPDGLGGTRKIQVQEKTSYNRDGTIKGITLVQLTGKGYKTVSNEQFQGAVDFMTGVGLISDDIVQSGKATLQSLKTDDVAKIQAAQRNYVEKADPKLAKTSNTYGKMVEGRSELLARHVAMSGLVAKNQGWGTNTVGREVAVSMILKDIDNEGYGDNVVTGLDNPFNTMIAVADLLDVKKLDPSTDAISKLASNGVKLYDSYYALDDDERLEIDSQLETHDYFSRYANEEAIENVINVVRFAVANNMNPTDYDSKAQMLSAAQGFMEKYGIQEQQERQEALDKKREEEDAERADKLLRESARRTSSLLFPPR